MTDWVKHFEEKRRGQQSPASSPSSAPGGGPYDALVDTAAQKYGLPRELLRAMIQQESSWRPDAVSPAGAQGLMQLMPATAAELGVTDPMDPAQNIDGGARYMSQLMERYGGDTRKALMAYNAGMGNVDRGKAESFPETQGYVRNIMGNLQTSTPAPMAAQQPATAGGSGTDWVAHFTNKRQQPQEHQPQAPQQQAASTTDQGSGRSWGDSVVDALPMIGGTIGGYVGGQAPLLSAIPAAIGGAAGTGYRSLLKNATELPGAVADIARNLVSGHARATLSGLDQGALEGLKEVGKEAGWEGGTQLAGGAIGRYVLKPAARLFTRGAFRPSASALKANPNVVDDILDNSYRLSEKGVEKAGARTTQSRQAAEALVDALENQPNRWISAPGTMPTSAAVPGSPVPEIFGSRRVNVGAELLDPVFARTTKAGGHRNTLGNIRQGADNQLGLRTAATVENSVRRSLPAEVGPRRLLEIKRAEAKKAIPVYGEGARTTARKGFNADIADAADAALGRRIGPQWGAANRETQRRLTTQKTIEDAVRGSSADTGMPSPFDQLLLMRGMAYGDPIALSMAFARGAGRGRPTVAAAGRGVNQLAQKGVPQNTFRAGRAVVNEVQEENKARERRREEIRKLYNQLPFRTADW